MRGTLVDLTAVARALGVALVAIAMVVAVLHVHAQTSRVERFFSDTSMLAAQPTRSAK